MAICGLPLQGDNDPVDVVEIGDAQLRMGGVYRVKPLGVYAMIDDGELDWKVSGCERRLDCCIFCSVPGTQGAGQGICSRCL